MVMVADCKAHAVLLEVAAHNPPTATAQGKPIRLSCQFGLYLVIASVVVEAFDLVVLHANLDRFAVSVAFHLCYGGGASVAVVHYCAGHTDLNRRGGNTLVKLA